MSSEKALTSKQAQILYDQMKTQTQETTQADSRRISTEEVPINKKSTKTPKIRLFQKTQFPTLSTKTSHNQNQYVLNSAIQKLIQQEIKKGKFFVSSTPVKYPLKPTKKIPQKILTPQQIHKQKLNQMENKKLKAIEILKEIENQEIQLRQKAVSLKYQKQSQQRKTIKKERSFFSPQQKRAVKKMFIRNKMIQNQLKQKTQRKIEEYQRISQTQRQKHNSHIQRHKSLSKSRIQQQRTLKKLKRSQEQKQRQMIEKNYEQVKNRRYLFQQMLEKDQKIAIQEMQEFTKKLEEIKSKMKIPVVQELKQHQKKIAQILKTKSKSFNKSKFSLDLNLSHMKKIQENYFTRLTKAERQSQRYNQQMTKSRPFQLKSRVKQFSQRCSTQVKPKIKITEESRFVPIQRNQSLNSLNYFQQYQKGKEYLSIAKKLKKCETAQQEKLLSTKQFDKIPNPPAKINYKNYLKDMRKTIQQNPENAKKNFALYLQKQGSISDYNSLQKAVSISQSIEAKNKRTKNQKLIDAVQNKIQLLKMIM